MATSFESELNELVTRFSRELAHEVTRLILRRLGIEDTAGAKVGRPAASAPRDGARVGPRDGNAKPTKKSRAAAAPAAPPARRRRSSADRALAKERVLAALTAGGGLSAGEVEKQTKLARAEVDRCLRALKEEGRAFMGGERRFARWAATQAGADRASADARK